MTDNLYVYFGCKPSTSIILGVAIYLKEGSAVDIAKNFKQIEKFEGENNFHWTLDAMILALDEALKLSPKYSNHQIVLMNQNALVFQWIENGCSNPNYEDKIGRIEEQLIALGIYRCSFKVIDGKVNRVKKLLDAQKVKGAETVHTFTRLQNVYRETSSKVIKFEAR
jgi:hypothetical protein